jgi:hypothetical protein
LEYPEWKSRHSPEKKFWLYPEQMTATPKIEMDDVNALQF